MPLRFQEKYNNDNIRLLSQVVDSFNGAAFRFERYYQHLEQRIRELNIELNNKNEELEIYGKQVVNATGIWTDEIVKDYPEDVPKPVIRPTKGVHIQYPRENIENVNAFGLRSIDDGRVFFVLSRGEVNVIGTTDTDYKGDLANPYCTKEDADYLIRSVKAVFPNAKLDYEHIISTYAGIRPLVMQKGKSESSVSRTHPGPKQCR